MTLNLYAMRDRKMNQYHAPQMAVNNQQAIRMFTEIMLNPQARYRDYPDDYDLVHVGCFSDETGLLEDAADKAVVMTGGDLMEEAVALKERREA